MMINKRLFTRIKKTILHKPASFDMDKWGGEREGKWGPCNTTFCIAGHAAVATGCTIKNTAGLWHGEVDFYKAGRKVDAETRGRKALGLTKAQGDALFFTYNWPERFQVRWEKAKTLRTKARIAAAVIDAFLMDPKQFVADANGY